jgi:hypothetical protein
MALWSRAEPPTPAVDGSGEYLGRTPEEAMARARAALGTSAELRCWKTRRGGVAGFFTTEVFVAGVTPPAGADRARSGARRAPRTAAKTMATESISAPTGRRGRGSAGKPGTPEVTAEPSVALNGASDPKDVTEEPPEQTDLPGPLAARVEGTTDQLSLQLDEFSAEAFDKMLAEAEAALAGESVAGSPEAPPSPPSQEASPVDGTLDGPSSEVQVPSPPPKVRRPKSAEPAAEPEGPATPTPDPLPAEVRGNVPPNLSPAAPPAQPASRRRPAKAAAKTPRSKPPAEPEVDPVGPERIADLNERLRMLGLPERHLPRGQRPTLDSLARAMGRLPEVPPLPTADGSVVVVVGGSEFVDQTVRMLLGQPRFAHGSRRAPVRHLWEGTDDGGCDDDLEGVVQAGDVLHVARCVALRRLEGHRSIVAIEAVPGIPVPSHPLAMIDRVQPDYVLGAVGALTKRSDVEQWRDGLESVDSLALWGLDSTSTPAELLGTLPIAFVDGEQCSPIGWTLALLSRALDADR